MSRTRDTSRDMDRFDPASAMLGGVFSVWVRLLLFFAAMCAGHGLGLIAGHIREEPLRMDLGWDSLAWVPLSVLWQCLLNFLYAPGFLYIPLILVLLLLMVFSDKPALPVAAAVLILQMWDTFLLGRLQGLSPWDDESSWGWLMVIALTALAVCGPFLLAFSIRRLAKPRNAPAEDAPEG